MSHEEPSMSPPPGYSWYKEFPKFTSELREKGLLPMDLAFEEERVWAKEHPEYAQEVLRREQMRLRVAALIEMRAPREQIAELLEAAKTGLDRMRDERKRKAYRALQDKA